MLWKAGVSSPPIEYTPFGPLTDIRGPIYFREALMEARWLAKYMWHMIRARPFTAVILHWDDFDDRGYARVTLLFTTEPELRDNGLFLLKMADRFFYSRRQDASTTEAERVLKSLFLQARNEPSWRVREIPSRLSDGVPLFIADTWIHAEKLYSDFEIWNKDDRLVPFKMDPSSDGPVFQRTYTRRQMLKRQPSRVAELLQRGEPVIGCRLMANYQMYAPGRGNRTGRVIISFDKRIRNLPEFLMEIRNRMAELRERPPQNEDERVVRTHLDDLDGYHVYERFKLPLKYAAGRIAYSASLQFVRRYLPAKYLRYDEDFFFPCVAEPGDSGAIEMLPPEFLKG